MKLIEVVKLQRVRYGDLDDGDRFIYERDGTYHTAGPDSWASLYPDDCFAALDTTKYPPEEITYNIEGIPEDHAVADSGMYFFPGYQFHESEIETRYI